MVKTPRGGRILDVPEEEAVMVVNKSNRDVSVNDCAEPFSLCVFRAGDISPKTWRTNCVQKYTRESAQGFMATQSDYLEIWPVGNVERKTGGLWLLARSRELGSFEKTYTELRKASLVDAAGSPMEVVARQRVIAALLKTGFMEKDIPANATVAELRALHTSRLKGQSHITLVMVDEDDPSGSTGGRLPVNVGGDKPESMDGDLWLERKKYTEITGKPWKPQWDLPRLTAEILSFNLKQKQQSEDAAAEAAGAVQSA